MPKKPLQITTKFFNGLSLGEQKIVTLVFNSYWQPRERPPYSENQISFMDAGGHAIFACACNYVWRRLVQPKLSQNEQLYNSSRLFQASDLNTAIYWSYRHTIKPATQRKIETDQRKMKLFLEALIAKIKKQSAKTIRCS